MRNVSFRIPVSTLEFPKYRKILYCSLNVDRDLLHEKMDKANRTCQDYVWFITTTCQFVSFLIHRNKFGFTNVWMALKVEFLDQEEEVPVTIDCTTN